MARITYTDAAGKAREATFRSRLTIGRHPAQDVQILDRVVSKEHAIIELRDGRMVLIDLGSRNGTTLNGEAVTDPVPLNDGDIVGIGSAELRFQGGSSVDSRPTPSSEFRAVPSVAKGVTIHDEAFASAIRKRLKDTGVRHFESADRVGDIEQLRADYEKLRIANELNNAVALEFDLERLLNRILEKAFEMFAADRGVIMLLDPESGEVTPAALKTRFGGDARDIRISRTILQEVIDEKAAVLSSDARMDSRFGGAHSIIIQGIRATMSVPLMYRERILGVIHLDSQLASDAFTEKDLSLLAGFAHQAARAIEHSRLVERAKNEALAREQLGRLLPQDLVDDVMAGRVEVRRGGQEAEVTVLFSDIRGFTAMSERLPAQEIVQLLNEYFEVMVDIVFRHGGMLDKFVGDEIMAVWGAPIPLADHTERAVSAAVEMQYALCDFNQARVAAGFEPIFMGVGVNSGEVVAGYMGASRSLDYTIIGDVVNTGARLCSAAERGQILVSEAVIAKVKDRFRFEPLPSKMMKGKRDAVPVFSILGYR